MGGYVHRTETRTVHPSEGELRPPSPAGPGLEAGVQDLRLKALVRGKPAARRLGNQVDRSKTGPLPRLPLIGSNAGGIRAPGIGGACAARESVEANTTSGGSALRRRDGRALGPTGDCRSVTAPATPARLPLSSSSDLKGKSGAARSALSKRLVMRESGSVRSAADRDSVTPGPEVWARCLLRPHDRSSGARPRDYCSPACSFSP